MLSGNADAHHKNFSLVFPDGRHARLATAYDQVATLHWTMASTDLKDNLPFQLGGSRRFEQVTLRSVQHMADATKLGAFQDRGQTITPDRYPSRFIEQATRILDSRGIADQLGGPGLRRTRDGHLARVPLVEQVATART